MVCIRVTAGKRALKCDGDVWFRAGAEKFCRYPVRRLWVFVYGLSVAAITWLSKRQQGTWVAECKIGAAEVSEEKFWPGYSTKFFEAANGVFS